MRGRTRRTPTAGRTAARLVAFRWRAVVLVLLAAAMLVLAAVGVLEVRDSAARAAQQSAAADQGGRAYAVQSTSDAGSALVAADDRIAGVAEDRARLRADGAEVDVDLRRTTDASLHLGVLVRGRFAEDASEVVVSSYVAGLLDADLGATVTVVDPADPTSSVDLTLVGTTLDPADREDLTASLVAPDLPPAEVSRWFTDADPYAAPELRAALDAGELAYRSTGSVAEETGAATPVLFADARSAGPALAVLDLVVLAGVVVAAAPATRPDHEGLRAAGWPESRVWRLYRTVLLATVLAGTALGAGAATALLTVLREPVSGVLGQQWQSVAVPWTWIGGFTLACAVAVGAARLLHAAARAVGSRIGASEPTPLRVSRFSVGLVVGGAVVLAVAGAARFQSPPGELTLLAPLGGGLVAAGLPGVVLPLMLVRLPPATRSLSRQVTGGLHVVTAVLCIVCVLVASRTAQTTHDTLVFEDASSAPQPAGSLVVSPVPLGAGEQIADAYADAGGEGVERFRLLEESPESMVRVTGTPLLACLDESGASDPNLLDPSCFPQDTYSPVNVVALGPSSLDGARADPGLLDGDSEVGLLRFSGASATPLRSVAAEPSEDLGGNLPGLLLPAGDPLLDELDLQPASAEMVVLTGFGALSPEVRAELRGVVSRVAPTAQAIDASGSSAYERSRGTAAATSVVAGALGLGLLLLVGGSVANSNRLARSQLVALAASGRRRAGLAALWVSGVGVCLLSTVPLGLLVAWVTTVNAASSFGWAWVVTAPLVGAAVPIVGVGMWRVGGLTPGPAV